MASSTALGIGFLAVVGLGVGVYYVTADKPAVARPMTAEARARADVAGREIKTRKMSAAGFGRELGVPADAVGDAVGDGSRTLGLELHACSDDALLEVVRTLKADRLTAAGFAHVWCVDGANEMKMRDL